MKEINTRLITRRRFLEIATVAGTSPWVMAQGQSAATVFASSQKQVNGVAVGRDGKTIVSMPRWSDGDTASVAIRSASGTLDAWPGDGWNTWHTGIDPVNRFVCVNAVHIDPKLSESVWVVDAAAPAFGDTVPSGPKLVQVNLAERRVTRSYPFQTDTVPANGYLNDVRFARGFAFLTESGTGAVLVLNLQTGKVRRLLADHPSTKAIPGRMPVVDGRKLSTPSGAPPIIHCDGIEVSLDHQFLLYAVPFGGSLWRIPISKLLEESLRASDLGNAVERLGPLMPIGGMTLASDGGLLLSDVEHHRIVHRSTDGALTGLQTSTLLQWPDASTLDRSGNLLVAASQVNHMPAFNGGENRITKPFHVVQVPMPASINDGPQS